MSTSMLNWVFVRHAHPISAWSRWASTPLVVVPLWYRRSWTALPIAAWMIINPIITPPVTGDRAFATRAILGEGQWIADPIKRRDIIALNAVGAACLSVAGVTAWRRRPLPMTVAIAGSMAVILLTWRSYAEFYDLGSSNVGLVLPSPASAKCLPVMKNVTWVAVEICQF